MGLSLRALLRKEKSGFLRTALMVALFPEVWGTMKMCMSRGLQMKPRKMASDLKYHNTI